MKQPDLFFPDAVNMMRRYEEKFTQDFMSWLPANLHVFHAFCTETLKIIDLGRDHYSAYTIVEFLRHHTALTETTGEWRINNNYRPYLARLFGLCYPEHEGIFEVRITKKVEQENNS